MLDPERERDEQVRFERWAGKHARNAWWLERDENGEYRSSLAEAEWRAWQAALEFSQDKNS